MNAFQFREWWRYRRLAKGRHGIHSPFVYRFVDEGLQLEISKAFGRSIRSASVSSHERAMAKTLYLCLKFLQPQSIYYEWAAERESFVASVLNEASVKLPIENKADTADCILLGNHDFEIVERIFSENAARMEKGLMFIVHDIHASPHNALQWLRLREDARVNLSIDLWHLGLLFYRADFKERQHFVLKYPV